MSRRMVAGLLTFLMLMSMTAAIVDLSVGTVSADSIGDYTYTTNNGGTEVEITGYTGSTGEVVIPSTLNNTPVTSIGVNAFYHSGITSISIPNSVTNIADFAFSICTGLKSVSIPNSVTKMGDDVFYYCSSLTSVTYPDSVTIIGNGTFYHCNSLTSVTLGNAVTSIGTTAFYGCGALTSVNIPESVTSIGAGAFFDCHSLVSISIPGAVTIGAGAFQSCTALTTVTIGNSLTSIGTYMFYNTALTDFVIPASVTSIGDNAFYDCVKLTSIVIPDKVTFIGNGSFSYCVNLTSITLGKAVNSIGNYEFSHCYALSSITFTGKVAPAYVGAEWIYYTPENITGHAYADSNFNTTAGAVFNELPMVVMAGSANGNGSGNDDTMLPIAIISVIALVLLAGFLLFIKRKKAVPPTMPSTIQQGPAAPIANPVPPVEQEAPTERPKIKPCPNCGYPNGDTTFCMKCGSKLK